jgi:hypothetical protein
VVLFGGAQAFGIGQGQHLRDTYEWDGTDWTRRVPIAIQPTASEDHRTTFFDRHLQRVVLSSSTP